MTLFDTSVVIDARDTDSPWHEWAKEQIAAANVTDEAVVNPVVIAESAGGFEQRDDIPELLQRMGFTLSPLPVSAAIRAAKAFAIYRKRPASQGKQPASRIPLGDFFIGAHAEAEGLKLVTRDPERVKTYFPAVKLIVPKNRGGIFTSARRLQSPERPVLASTRGQLNRKAPAAIGGLLPRPSAPGNFHRTP
jgi:predicted nucleic acid-binding protein